METSKRTIRFDFDVVTPCNEHLLGKYLLGTRFLMNYKNYLLMDNDESYDSFLDIYEQATYKSLLDIDRMFALYQMVLATNHIGGCTAECGVYRGGASLLIASSNNNRPHYALDSFEGLPEVNPEFDPKEQPDFSDVVFKDVQSALSGCENVFFLKGFFTDTFPGISEKKFSFVHLDGDLYQSTLDCCEFFYPRLIPSARMLFDDYLSPNTQTAGVKTATDGFFNDKPEHVIILPSCQGLVVKL